MKGLILALGVTVGMLFSNSVAQDTPIGGGPQIEFEKKVHDYGTIEKGANGVCEFKFTNTGNSPLMIQNAKGSCGCTVPVWPKEPIAANASGTIKVKYDTNRPGAINKSVTITTNVKDNPTVVIRIRGTVNAAPAASPTAPAGPASGNS
jgi:hypothetical protein